MMSPSEINSLFKEFGGEINSTNSTIGFNLTDNTELERLFASHQISFTPSGNHRSVAISALSYEVFKDRTDLINRYKVSTKRIPWFILDFSGSPVFVDFENGVISDLNQQTISDEYLTAFINYQKLYLLLLDEAKRGRSQIGFIDFYDELTREFVLITNKNDSIEFTYDKAFDSHSKYKELGAALTSIIDAFDKYTSVYRLMLKNSIYKRLVDEDVGERYKVLASNLKAIASSSEKDYLLYSSELSIDNLKNQYQQFRSKFYTDTSDILNKVSNYIIGLPVATVGATFSIYKTKDSIAALWIIGLTLFAVAIVVAFVLEHYKEDLKSIDKTAELDYNLLKNQTFFKKNKTEGEIFKEINQRLLNKIKSTERIINAQYWLMCIATCTLICYCRYVTLKDVTDNDWHKLIVGFLILLLVSAAGPNLIVKFRKD